MARILYFNHDSLQPSGGVRTVYSHVRHLVCNGFTAFVVHYDPDFRPAWFAPSVPTLFCRDGLTLQSDDVLIFPEDYPIAREPVRSVQVRKIVFCQNHFYIFEGLPVGQSWQDLGISTVFAGSEVMAQFIQANLGWPRVPVVHYAIDHGLFQPGPKKVQVAYMPRKVALEGRFIRGLCTRLAAPSEQVDWVAIDGVPQERVAAILRESALFLSLSRLEGLGLPPLEAMACGCVVVGYHGYGGLEYANSKNGFWCDEGDPVACARAVQRVIESVRNNSPEIPQVIEAGIQTAARYTPQREEAELLHFIRSVVMSG